MIFDLQTSLDSRSTRIAVAPNLLREVGSLLRAFVSGPPGPQAVVITDKHVGPIYGEALRASLEAAGFPTLEYRLEPGEASKCLSVAGELYRYLSDHAVGRDAVLIALGGGMVSDLAGFVAATWMRGVRFAICPTTLEADVDASIGGKTAINVPGGKNLVGAFHQPLLVAVDSACLKTLDHRDVRAGLAESIKHALITSEEFLAWHEANVEAILALDEARITELIIKNVRIKARIVEQDPYEQRDRRVLLNFGHTIGHAIEACTLAPPPLTGGRRGGLDERPSAVTATPRGGRRVVPPTPPLSEGERVRSEDRPAIPNEFPLRHGECVALGMLAACRISRAMGLLDESVVTRVEALLTRLGLPTQLVAIPPPLRGGQGGGVGRGPRPIDTDRIMTTIRNDKKVRGNAQRFVLLEGIGKPTVRNDVPEQQAREAYESLLP